MNKSLGLHYLKLSADRGYMLSQYRYGCMLSSGDGIDMNKSLASNYLKLSTDQGHAIAQWRYGFMLFSGHGINMDKSLASHYLKLSADQGNPDAQCAYGFMLFTGDGINMNKSLASHYLKLSADQGNAIAQLSYGFMLSSGDDIDMNKSLASYYLKLSADQSVCEAQLEYADYILCGDTRRINFREYEKYLRLAVCQHSPAAQMRLGLCLFSGTFGRFNFTESRTLFEEMSVSTRFAAILRNSLSRSDCELICASDFSRTGNIFSFLRSSFDEAIALIRILNADLFGFAFDDCSRFATWRDIAGSSFLYLVDLSQAQSYVLGSLPSDCLSCDSISAMIEIIFRMYTIDSSLYKNVNQCLRCFPISMVSKFMRELRGILYYIYLLQSSIDYYSHAKPIQENLVVYRGIAGSASLGLLYETMIGDVVVWPGFTSTSIDCNSVLRSFIHNEDSVLFEIELHPGDAAVLIEQYYEYGSEREILIAASTGFEVLRVDYADVSIPQKNGDSHFFHLLIVRLSYFLHWYDFDLDQRPLPVLV
jgi:hypothetical protein